MHLTKRLEDINYATNAILGVLTPEDLGGSATSPPGNNDGVLTFFSTLSTKEMIALACGGAGFFLFIVVIVIIIFKVRKRNQKRTKKQKGWFSKLVATPHSTF